jgi:hypothetical protein
MGDGTPPGAVESTAKLCGPVDLNTGFIRSTVASSESPRRRLNGFEFLRNEALNARNFFQAAAVASSPPQANNPVKPAYRRNQFGATFGGPLVPDHTFFFVDNTCSRPVC